MDGNVEFSESKTRVELHPGTQLRLGPLTVVAPSIVVAIAETANGTAYPLGHAPNLAEAQARMEQWLSDACDAGRLLPLRVRYFAFPEGKAPVALAGDSYPTHH